MENSDLDCTFDVWGALRRRKWWSLAAFIAVAALALAYASLAPRVYESRAAFRIGSIAGNGYREAPGPGREAMLVEGLLEEPQPLMGWLEGVSARSADGTAWLGKLSQDRRDPLTISIVAYGGTREAARAQAQRAVDAVLERHRATFEESASATTAQIKALQAARQRTASMLEMAEKKARNGGGGDVVLLAATASLSHDLLGIDGELARLQSNQRRSRPTSVISAPSSLAKAVLPNLRLVLVAGFFAALLAAVGAAAVADALAGKRARAAVSRGMAGFRPPERNE